MSEGVGNGNGDVLGYGEHRDIHLVRGKIALKLVHAENGNALEGGSDDTGLNVERTGQLKAPFREAEVIHKRVTDVADADKHRLEAAIHTEDRGNLRAKRKHIVAVALLTELTEAAEVLPDLRRGKTELLTQCERRNTADPVLGKLIELTQISGQTTYDVI